jgi:hypothetical protein
LESGKGLIAPRPVSPSEFSKSHDGVLAEDSVRASGRQLGVQGLLGRLRGPPTHPPPDGMRDNPHRIPPPDPGFRVIYVDALCGLNLPAFTFGGVGDGLPDGIGSYLKARQIVILADDDDAGREHADKKAAVAHAAGAASTRIVHFPELTHKGDVSEFIAKGGTAEQLRARIGAAMLWSPANRAAYPGEASAGERQNRRQLVIRRADEITARAIEWLWPGRIARG